MQSNIDALPGITYPIQVEAAERGSTPPPVPAAYRREVFNPSIVDKLASIIEPEVEHGAEPYTGWKMAEVISASQMPKSIFESSEPIIVSRPTLDLSQHADRLCIRLPSTGYNLQSIAKQLGARWNARENGWLLPLYIHQANAVQEAYKWNNLVLSESVEKWKIGRVTELPPMKPGIREVYDSLFDYQQEAVGWLVDHPYEHPGLLLALSPGLGKTIVAMEAAQILEFQRVLIISPLSLITVWQTEYLKWYGKMLRYKEVPRLTPAHGNKPAKEGWVVTNYNTVTSPRLCSEFLEDSWDLLIIDESVLVKNRKTQRFLNIKNLRESAERVWELSGSPITKHPDDLWSQYHLIDSKAFPSYWRFTKRYCTTESNVWAKGVGSHGGTVVTGDQGRNLPDEFMDIMMVRNQEQVLQTRHKYAKLTREEWSTAKLFLLSAPNADTEILGYKLPESYKDDLCSECGRLSKAHLPDMIFQHIPCRMTVEQERTYVRMLKEYVAYLESPDTPEVDAQAKLAQLIRLQQIASNVFNLNGKRFLETKTPWPDLSGKDDTLLELLESEAIEFPALIWTHWKPGAHALYHKLIAAKYSAEVIYGGMDQDEVDEKFEAYKDGDVDILILSLGVGKFGHTLTNTKTIVYKDKTWAADDYIQSLHRVRRIGLMHIPRVLSLICPGTVDDLVEDNLAGKMAPISNVTNSDLAKLLKGLNRDFLK